MAVDSSGAWLLLAVCTLVCSAAVGVLSQGATSATGPTPPPPGEPPLPPPQLGGPDYATYSRVGYETFIWGQPLVAFFREQATTGIVNGYSHQSAIAHAGTTDIPFPNVDTLYGAAFLDLAGGPQVLSMPDFGQGRYYSAAFFEAYGRAISINGSLANGCGPTTFLIIGPDWNGTSSPAFAGSSIQSPTNDVFLITRVRVANATDLASASQLSSKIYLSSLTTYLENTSSSSANSSAAPAPDQPSSSLSEALQRLVLIGRGLVNDPPPDTAGNNRVVHDMAMIGISQTAGFDPYNVTGEQARALNVSQVAADTSIQGWMVGTTINDSYSSVNHWAITQVLYNQDRFLQRAAVSARGGLGGLPPSECVYFLCYESQDGQIMEGSSQYILPLDPPAVRGFWSVTLYNLSSQSLPLGISKSSVGDSSPGLEADSDGTVTILIQPGSPGAALEANWLPSVPGMLVALILRAYGPMPSVLNGSYVPAAVLPTAPQSVPTLANFTLDPLMMCGIQT
eukprot:SM000075S21947  [mRNA]  locus=s75:284762:287544:+ [translate_table: standard]